MNENMMVGNWEQYFGGDVDAADYAAGCDIDLQERIEEDLTDLWGSNAEPGDRLTAEQIITIASHLAGYAARALYERNTQYVELTD